MSPLVADSTKRALTYGLVTVSGLMLVVAGSRDGDPTTTLAGSLLALVAAIALALEVTK